MSKLIVIEPSIPFENSNVDTECVSTSTAINSPYRGPFSISLCEKEREAIPETRFIGPSKDTIAVR